MMDPRARQRVQTVTVRPIVREDLSNGELLARFEQATRGNIAEKSLPGYVAAVRDAIRYFREPDTGREIPVKTWRKEAIWGYLDFVENNYCASFNYLAFQGEGAGATCKQRVWVGSMPAEAAAREKCGGCPLFRKPTLRHRLNALGKWFKYLARVGAIPHNVMSDVIAEFYEERPGISRAQHGERRRNPTVDEMRRLVNETAHPQRRAFYAVSAKNWFRPKEMMKLDRYASLGLPMPAHLPTPRGFEGGFIGHPHLPGFDKGGDLLYVPSSGRTDKRKGNRWGVVDAELRPIVEQHLAWWERHVARDSQGRPRHSSLWINDHGMPLQQATMYPALFYEDCERLGLMRPPSENDPGDRADPLRKWSAHCQRHFGEKVRQMANVPSDWNNHFRGDKLPDARGFYYHPTPEDVRAKYHELIPFLGFKPLPDAPRAQGKATAGPLAEGEAHKATLRAEIERARKLKNGGGAVVCARITSHGGKGGEAWTVPKRAAPAVLFALRVGRPDHGLRIEEDPETVAILARGGRGRWMSAGALVDLYTRALQMLG